MRLSAAPLMLLCGLASTSALAQLSENVMKAGEKLISFRAVYDLTLVDNKNSSRLVNALGRFVVQGQRDSCDGLETFGRIHLIWKGEEDEEVFHSSNDSNYEKMDGKTFIFKAETNKNGEEESTVGEAVKGTESVTVTLKKPQDKKLTVSSDAIFPIELSLRTIEKAMQGEHVFSAKVYSAMNEGEHANPVMVMIGDKITDKDLNLLEEPLKALKLSLGDRWRVKTSYFDEKGQDNEPLFVVSGELFEQGFYQNMKVIYTDYVLQAEMKKFEVLENVKKCGPSF